MLHSDKQIVSFTDIALDILVYSKYILDNYLNFLPMKRPIKKGAKQIIPNFNSPNHPSNSSDRSIIYSV